MEVYEAGFCVSRGVFRVPIKVIVIDIHLKGCMSFKIIGINKKSKNTGSLANPSLTKELSHSYED